MEAVLRPYGLGLSQWYVMYHLANEGPIAQRSLPGMLQLEKPTLSEAVGALVRKGLVDQSTDPSDLRQRILTITPAGLSLWKDLPDPIEMILAISFAGFDESELATVVRVLRTATQRLNDNLPEGSKS